MKKQQGLNIKVCFTRLRAFKQCRAQLCRNTEILILSMSLPPELQVLCRRLASTDADDLPPLCPSLVGHVQRCSKVLSLPVDQKPKDGAPAQSVLVHKLKTQITTLLNNGRSQPGRFAAAILIKAVVDVGGYECLRTSEPWVRGLLTILQVRLASLPPQFMHASHLIIIPEK